MTISCLGIDPSTTATGIAVLEAKVGKKGVIQGVQHTIKIDGTASFSKAMQIADQLSDIITEVQPNFIVIEGYGVNFKRASSVLPLVELGTCIRCMLRDKSRPWLEPRPSQVKQFMTGNGAATKQAVKLKLKGAWDVNAANLDTSDAYACALMGLGFKQLIAPLSTTQWELIGALSVCN